MSDTKGYRNSDAECGKQTLNEMTVGVTDDHYEKKTLIKRILRVIWDSLDKTPEERKFIRKVDAWIMSYVCVAYLVKYLDQTNVCTPFSSSKWSTSKNLTGRQCLRLWHERRSQNERQ